MAELRSQDIEVGPVRVDTGDDWLDFGFVLVLLVVASVLYVCVKRLTK